MEALFTRQEAAARFRVSTKTLDKHVAAGVLRYVSIGLGRQHIRRMFAPSDLEAFIEAQTRKDVPLCPSRSPATRPSTTTRSNTEVIAFTAQPRPRQAAAEEVERLERDKARAAVDQLKGAATSLRLDDVAERYWLDIGQHHAGEGAPNTKTPARPPDRVLRQGQADHRHHRRRHRATGRVAARPSLARPIISPFTVNDTTEQLKKLFTRAKLWGAFPARTALAPALAYRAAGARQRARATSASGSRRPRVTSMRRSSPSPKPPDCARPNACSDGARSTGTTSGSSRRARATRPSCAITSEVRAILWPLNGQHPEYVFTYVADRTPADRVKGERYPITLPASRRSGGGCASGQGYRVFASTTSATTSPPSFCARPATSSSCRARSTTPTSRRRCVTPMSSDGDVAAAMRRFREQNFDARPTTSPTTNAPEARKPLRQRG